MKKIHIDLVSFVHGQSDKQRLSLTRKLINDSCAHIILFCGHTLRFVNDIEKLRKEIENNQSEIIFELQDINSEKINNCLYRISSGRLENMYTNQLFTTSKEIEGNYQLAERLLNEFTTKRQIKLKGFNVLIIQCGELNILKNIQSKQNKVEFRVTDNNSLSGNFDELFQQTDIFLNPIHTPMGNQGKMEKRRIFLSKNNRYYFSTSNTKPNSINLNLKGLQYAYFDGKPLREIKQKQTEKAIIRTYDIEKI